MCNCHALLKAIDAYIAKADDKLEGLLNDAGYIKARRTLKFASQIETDVADALVEETDYFLKAAEKAVDLDSFAKDVWPEVKLNDTLKSKLVTVFTESLSEFMPEFVGYYIKSTDAKLQFERLSKRTVAWVESWSTQLADIMQLTSHKQIEQILTSGLKEGYGMAEFTRHILESGIRDEYYKARRVAVTEVLRAHSVSQQESYMQSPAVSGKGWKHTGDYRNEPRQNHVDIDGQTVAVDEPFVLEGADGETYYPMYPRDTILPPGESVNCHCIIQPIVDEKILVLSLEERQALQQQAIDDMDEDWEAELDAQNRAKAGIE